MSLLDENIEELIEITVYYKLKKEGNNKKLIVIEDKKIEELLKDEEKKKGIEKLTTKWKLMNWEEQNETSRKSIITITNQLTGLPHRQVDPITYRENVVKKCLKQWDLTKNGQPVPVSDEFINKLPAPIILELFEKFQSLIEYSEDEVKN